MEIKFRAWDKKDQRFIEGGELVFLLYPGTDKNWEININEQFYRNTDNHGDNDSNRFELNQFTGLLDKNGKEIYVGDIIRVSGIGLLEVKMKGYLQVEFCNKKSIRDFQDIIEEDILIKGNIYQNKDLLDNN